MLQSTLLHIFVHQSESQTPWENGLRTNCLMEHEKWKIPKHTSWLNAAQVVKISLRQRNFRR